MPIEDAFTLLTRNFDAYMRGEQLVRNTNGTGVNNLSDRHPESIQVLQYITVLQLISDSFFPFRCY